MKRHWHLPLGPLALDFNVTTNNETDAVTSVELDPLLLDPDLLSVMASFKTIGWYPVHEVAEELGLPTDAMTQHVARLREAACVDTRTGSDSVEWMQITHPGTLRLASHVIALQHTASSTRRLADPMRRQ
jgi:hypothetical protein